MTETQTLTLDAFLLARIAEDEAAVEWATEQGGLSIGGDEHGYPTIPRSRVLAECEAKRRIVRDYVHAGDCAELEAEGDRIDEAHDQWALEAALEISLRALALPYADHPDYREEWKP